MRKMTDKENFESSKKLAAHHRENRVALCLSRPWATRCFLIISFLLSFVMLLQGTGRTEVPPDYAAYWRFEQETYGMTPDETGMNNGTLQGDAAIISDPEKGNVLSLDGNGDYVDCGNDATLSPDHITIAAWVKPEEVAEITKYILSKRLSYFLDAMRGWAGADRPHFYIYTNNANYYNATSDVKLNADTWNHIAATYDGYQIKIYINGIEASSADYSVGFIQTTAHSLRIGMGQLFTDSNCFSGEIDDVLVYSRGLSASEIKEVYVATGGIEEDMILGDVTGDGDVSAYDASLAAQYAVGFIDLTPDEILRADVTLNGDISAYDASLIAQYAIGLIDSF